jgi:hypothetical protein
VGEGRFTDLRRARERGERGAVAVLFALLIPLLLLPIGAIAVDIGFWYVNAKQAQTTADAGALAAAMQIPNTASVEASGGEYVLRNMPGATYEVEYPYVPDGGPDWNVPQLDEVEVTVRHPAPTFFGRIFGRFGVSSTRRAVAEMWEEPGKMAIFAHRSSTCDSGGLEFNGTDIYINGYIHSNGQFRVDGGPFWAADGTLWRDNCVSSIDEDVEFAQFGEDLPPPWGNDCGGSPCREPRDWFSPAPMNWPAWYTPAEFGWFTGCTYRAEQIEITSSQVKLNNPSQTINHGGAVPPGVYCATKSFKIAGDNVSGTLSALAPEITVDGNNQDLLPYANEVLFFTVPNNDFVPANDGSLAAGGNPTCTPSPAVPMILNGNGHTWAGTIFSPCGQVVVNVGGSTVGSPALVGSIVARDVRINGTDFHMVGDSPGDDDTRIALVE